MNVIPTLLLVSIVRRVSIVRLVNVRLVKHANPDVEEGSAAASITCIHIIFYFSCFEFYLIIQWNTQQMIIRKNVLIIPEY